MKKNNKGFTMAELLIVVAIIVILMGVAFVAVQNYQRSSTRLEFDGIAKEIFIAAQNHLTAAESQGYVQMTGDQQSEDLPKKLGTKGNSPLDTKDERYFVYDAVDTYSTNPQKSESVLDLMLPFGAIDETVRAGGSYIIRYQPSSGRILDVFYSLPGKSSMLTVSGVKLSGEDYATLMDGYRGEANTRERFKNQNGTGVVGWYGGEEGLPTGTRLEAPEITVHNEELLWVEVTDNNNGNGSLKLIITGVTSGAQKSFEQNVTNSFDVILDDITAAEKHFADLKGDNTDEAGNTIAFIPGEDIIIEAVAYNNSAITNVAYSGQKRTNSLFAEIKKETGETGAEYVALVENFRHFENLDQTISGFSYNGAIKKENGDAFETISKARQIKNLNWKENPAENPTEKPDSFIEAVIYIKENSVPSVSIYNNNDQVVAQNNCLYPVSPTYKLEYDGKSNDIYHKISGVDVSGSDDAGLFGKITVPDSEIKNLELIDFTVSGETTAGALVGSATDTVITNVVVHNSIDKKTNQEKLTNNIESSSGIAGGLIGSMSSSSVTECAAAVYVNGGTSAGGLIGEIGPADKSSTVTACYSAGHTNNGAYIDNSFDVTGTITGGLIGYAENTTIENSYSTCSATGDTAVGGLIGTGSGSVTGCYATGLVNGQEAGSASTGTSGTGTTSAGIGAFAGSFSGTIENNYYYMIINEIKDNDGIFTGEYLKPVNGGDHDGVAALDADAATYDSFAGKSSNAAIPYDGKLTDYYGATYFLRGIAVSSGEDGSEMPVFVSTHYGDWPAPEIFVINQQ